MMTTTNLGRTIYDELIAHLSHHWWIKHCYEIFFLVNTVFMVEALGGGGKSSADIKKLLRRATFLASMNFSVRNIKILAGHTS